MGKFSFLSSGTYHNRQIGLDFFLFKHYLLVNRFLTLHSDVFTSNFVAVCYFRTSGHSTGCVNTLFTTIQLKYPLYSGIQFSSKNAHFDISFLTVVKPLIAL